MKVAPFSLLLALLLSSGAPSAVMANDSDGGVAGRKLRSGKGGSCDLSDPVTGFRQQAGFAQIAARLCDTLGAAVIVIVGEEQGATRSECAVQLTQLALQVLGDLFPVDTSTIAAADANGNGSLEIIEMVPIIMAQFGDLCPEEVYALDPALFVGWHGEAPRPRFNL